MNDVGPYVPQAALARPWSISIRLTKSDVATQKTRSFKKCSERLGDCLSKQITPRQKIPTSSKRVGIFLSVGAWRKKIATDRGREELAPSPPSEPCGRFSRARLSSRWFPHRDWPARTKASNKVKSPLRRRKPRAANMRRREPVYPTVSIWAHDAETNS